MGAGIEILLPQPYIPCPGKKNKFNDFNKDGSQRGTYSLGLDKFGLEGY